MFVPMLGRIYASEKFPHILTDKKALELKDRLPTDLKGKDTQMYFYVDRAQEMADEIGASVLYEEPYYAHTDKSGLKLMTTVTMKSSDRFTMVKMVHLKLGKNS